MKYNDIYIYIYMERKEDGIVTNCHSPLTPMKGGQRYKAEKPMLIDSITGVTS